MSTDARSAFVAAVVADPADDATRLVFADWLEESGALAPEYAARLRLPGRWELHADAWDQHRLCWKADAGRPDYVLAGYHRAPAPDCESGGHTAGWHAGLTFAGRWVCWRCAARLAREAVRA